MHLRLRFLAELNRIFTAENDTISAENVKIQRLDSDFFQNGARTELFVPFHG